MRGEAGSASPDDRPVPPANGWRAEPLVFSLHDFLRTGSFEDLRIGQSKELVRSRVPEPLDWALTGDGTESDLWSYGRLDLIFVDGKLSSIFCDNLGGFGDESAEEEHVTVDPWFLADPLPGMAEVRGRLAGSGLAVREGRVAEYLRAYRHDLVIEGSEVTLMFEADRPGVPLVAFWLDRTPG